MEKLRNIKHFFPRFYIFLNFYKSFFFLNLRHLFMGYLYIDIISFGYTHSVKFLAGFFAPDVDTEVIRRQRCIGQLLLFEFHGVPTSNLSPEAISRCIYSSVSPENLWNCNILIVWHIDPLRGNDRETNNATTAIARQQLSKYATILATLVGSGQRETMESTVGSGVFYVVRSETVPLDRPGSVSAMEWSELVGWLVGWLVNE
jgi:hypothetical protein